MRIARRKPAFLIALPESGVHAKIKKKLIAMRSPPGNHSEVIAKKTGLTPRH